MKKTILTSMIGALLMAQTALADQLAIVGGTMHTMGEQGTVTDKALLINDGRIEAVVERNAIPEGYTQVNASGKVVTPGLIVPLSQLGMVEVSSSAGPVDYSVGENDFSPTGAALDASFAINPASTLFPITRIEGITSAATSLSYTHGIFQGQGAVISLSGEGDALIKPRAFMRMDISHRGLNRIGGSRGLLWPQLISVFDEVANREGQIVEPGEEYKGTLTPADVNALIDVLGGQRLLLVEANRASDIRQLLKLKARYPGLQVAISGAAEAWMVAEQLAQAEVAVILNPESNLPYGFDQTAATMANAGRLAEAGVNVSIGMNTHNARLITQNAGNAVANGMSWEDALAALTINPATLYGVEQDYGSLEPGKVADVVIWSGDPLEVMEAAEQVYINGEAIDMSSRQTKLRDRYLKRDKDKPVQYSRP